MSKTTVQTLRLGILSDPADLKSVRKKVERYITQIGLDEKSATQVVLAMDEALTNIIRHAYRGAEDKPIEIDLSNRPGRLHIIVRDYGRKEKRENIRSRDLDDVRPGGLGVHIMHECMDSVEYTHMADGGTLLTMTKNIPSAGNLNGGRKQ